MKIVDYVYLLPGSCDSWPELHECVEQLRALCRNVKIVLPAKWTRSEPIERG